VFQVGHAERPLPRYCVVVCEAMVLPEAHQGGLVLLHRLCFPVPQSGSLWAAGGQGMEAAGRIAPGEPLDHGQHTLFVTTLPTRHDVEHHDGAAALIPSGLRRGSVRRDGAALVEELPERLDGGLPPGGGEKGVHPGDDLMRAAVNRPTGAGIQRIHPSADDDEVAAGGGVIQPFVEGGDACFDSLGRKQHAAVGHLEVGGGAELCELRRGVGGQRQLLHFQVRQGLTRSVESPLASRGDEDLGECQRARREIVVDLITEKRLGSGVVSVFTIEKGDQHTGIEHDHAGHSSRSRSKSPGP